MSSENYFRPKSTPLSLRRSSSEKQKVRSSVLPGKGNSFKMGKRKTGASRGESPKKRKDSVSRRDTGAVAYEVDSSFNGTDPADIVLKVIGHGSMELNDILLTTYLAFTDAQNIFELICGSVITCQDAGYITNVITFMLRWLSPHFIEDFKENFVVLEEPMAEFINSYLRTLDVSTKVAMLSSRLIHQYDEDMNDGFRFKEVLSPTVEDPILYEGLISHGSELRLKDIPLLELARQITLLESETFFKVPYKELLSVVWPKKFENNSYKDDMVLFFNTTSTWVITEILRCKKLSNRIKTTSLFIDLAANMWDLKNFNSVFSIISAIQSTPIIRLKTIFRGLSKRSTGVLDELKNLISHTKSYSNYRSVLEEVEPPFIPYIGLILSDLTFIAEMEDRDDDNINFVKNSLVWKSINTLHRAREVRHNVVIVNSFMEYIKYSRNNLFSEDVQYKFSQYFSDSKADIPTEMVLLQDIDTATLSDYFKVITTNQDIFNEFKIFLSKSFSAEELNLYRDLKNYKASLYRSTIPEESLDILNEYLGHGKKPYKLSVVPETSEVVTNAIEKVQKFQVKNFQTSSLDRNCFDVLYEEIEAFLLQEWLKFCEICKRKKAFSSSTDYHEDISDIQSVFENEYHFHGFHDYLLELFSHEYLEFWRDVYQLKYKFSNEAALELAEKWLGYPQLNQNIISFSYESSVSEVLTKLASGEFDHTIFNVLIDDCKEILLSKWSDYLKTIQSSKRRKKKHSGVSARKQKRE